MDPLYETASTTSSSARILRPETIASSREARVRAPEGSPTRHGASAHTRGCARLLQRRPRANSLRSCFRPRGIVTSPEAGRALCHEPRSGDWRFLALEAVAAARTTAPRGRSSATSRLRAWQSDRAVDGGPGDYFVAFAIARRAADGAIPFVNSARPLAACVTPRAGREQRRGVTVADDSFAQRGPRGARRRPFAEPHHLRG